MATETIERAPQAVGAQTPAFRKASGWMNNASAEQVARGLGWFSFGLGMAEILMPGVMSRIVGARTRNPVLMRLLGVREIAAGAMIFAGARAAGCWSRVAGDAMDLALIGRVLGERKSNKTAAVLSMSNVAAVTALDALTAIELTRSGSGAFDVRLERSIIVDRSPEECYAFWHDFQNLPRFMVHLKSVRPSGDKRQHWVAEGPRGVRVEWDAEITSDRPNECISWRSLEGADIDHAGSVHFERAPDGRGTIVRVTMYYSPARFAAGGAAVAQLLGKVPEEEIYRDLRRFKQMLEVGEVLTTEGQPAGRASGATWLDALARR